MWPARQSDKQRQGQCWEQRALRHLVGHGLKLVEANYHCKSGEIDLILRDGDALVFVEVRYRRSAGTASSSFGGGAASVDANKRRKLVHAASLFLAAHREFSRAPCRFDVIDASGAVDAPDFIWLRDAFRADDC